MKKHATVLALILTFVVLAPAAQAAGDRPTDGEFDVIGWITDGFDTLWNAMVDDAPPAEPAPSEEAPASDEPDDGSDEFGPELVPIG